MEIKFINNTREINLSDDWIDSQDFNNKYEIVKHSGLEYKLIAKKERTYPIAERIGRVALGILAVCGSLGFALISQKVRGLFSNEKKVIAFGVLYEPPQTSRQIIKLVEIGNFCAQSLPCQHTCVVMYSDGEMERESLDGDTIAELMKKPGSENIKNPWGADHFSDD